MRRLCLSLNLRRTERAVTRHYDEYLAGAGLTAAQFPILAVIATLESPTFRRLAEELDLERSTLSRNLALLESKGLVAIEPSSGRRAGRLSLTRNGRAALRRAYDLWREAHDALGKVLTADAISEGLQFLKTLRRQVRAVSTPGA
ncbi:MAG TPA: MarR family transcriptional regulator [Vicinamibacterales bacterium]